MQPDHSSLCLVDSRPCRQPTAVGAWWTAGHAASPQQSGPRGQQAMQSTHSSRSLVDSRPCSQPTAVRASWTAGHAASPQKSVPGGQQPMQPAHSSRHLVDSSPCSQNHSWQSAPGGQQAMQSAPRSSAPGEQQAVQPAPQHKATGKRQAVRATSCHSHNQPTRTASHKITSLEVPRWADPRKEVILRCAYERHPNDPPLHSVKWYRDTDEIFRYTPQELETRAFNSSGISIVNCSCDARVCWLTVRPERGTAKYTCEVSSEGPRFAVDRRSANMTLAVLPEYDPLITGLPTMVQAGENAIINCTSDYSLPAAVIDWFVDSEPQEDPLIVSKNHISSADSEGLQASWRTLHVYPDDYATHRGYLSLRCRSTLPTSPPHVTSMSVRLFVAARQHISSYMFSKNNAATGGSCTHRFRAEMTVWTLVVLLVTQVPYLVK